MAKVSEKPALKSQSAQGVLGTFLTGPQVFPPPFLHELFSQVVPAQHHREHLLFDPLHWSVPWLFPKGRHESGLSRLHLLRRAETMKTWRGTFFPGFSAELSNPLCSSKEIYLLSVKEVDRAALTADSGVRPMWVCVLTLLTSPLTLGRWPFFFSSSIQEVWWYLPPSGSYRTSRRWRGTGLSIVLALHERPVGVS